MGLGGGRRHRTTREKVTRGGNREGNGNRAAANHTRHPCGGVDSNGEKGSGKAKGEWGRRERKGLGVADGEKKVKKYILERST